MKRRLPSLLGGTAVGAVLVAALALPAGAQEAPPTTPIPRERFKIEVPEIDTDALTLYVPRTPPGSNAGTPSAFGPGWGDFFVGGGMQSRIRYFHADRFRDNVDGSLSAGFGLGNPSRYVGVEVAYTSLGTFDSGFGKRGTVSLKLHRLLPGNSAVAVGWENAAQIGTNDAGESFYAVGSKVLSFRDAREPLSTLTLSVGAGNGRFLFEDDFLEGKDGVNLFGSMALRVLEPVSLIADWTGQDLALGASIVPFRGIPLAITPALVDVTGTAGDGARFTLGAGMGFPIAPLKR